MEGLKQILFTKLKVIYLFLRYSPHHTYLQMPKLLYIFSIIFSLILAPYEQGLDKIGVVQVSVIPLLTCKIYKPVN